MESSGDIDAGTLNLQKLSRINKFDGIINNIAFNTIGIKCYVTFITLNDFIYTNWTVDDKSLEECLDSYSFKNRSNKANYLNWEGICENYIHSEKKNNPYMLTLSKTITDRSGIKEYGVFLLSIPKGELSKTMSVSEQTQQRVMLDDKMMVVSSTRKDWLNKSFGSIITENLPDD